MATVRKLNIDKIEEFIQRLMKIRDVMTLIEGEPIFTDKDGLRAGVKTSLSSLSNEIRNYNLDSAVKISEAEI